MPDFDPDELVTVATIAERHQVGVNAVYTWRHRGLLPDPVQRYGNVLLWRWRDVAGRPTGEGA
jgi:hypothetical protein